MKTTRSVHHASPRGRASPRPDDASSRRCGPCPASGSCPRSAWRPWPAERVSACRPCCASSATAPDCSRRRGSTPRPSSPPSGTRPTGGRAEALRVLLDHYELRGDAVLLLLGQERTDPAVRRLTDHGRRMHRDWVRDGLRRRTRPRRSGDGDRGPARRRHRRLHLEAAPQGPGPQPHPHREPDHPAHRRGPRRRRPNRPGARPGQRGRTRWLRSCSSPGTAVATCRPRSRSPASCSAEDTTPASWGTAARANRSRRPATGSRRTPRQRTSSGAGPAPWHSRSGSSATAAMGRDLLAAVRRRPVRPRRHRRAPARRSGRSATRWAALRAAAALLRRLPARRLAARAGRHVGAGARSAAESGLGPGHAEHRRDTARAGPRS